VLKWNGLKQFHKLATNEVWFDNLLPAAAVTCWQVLGAHGTDISFVRSLLFILDGKEVGGLLVTILGF
jgi:hypothetical protein